MNPVETATQRFNDGFNCAQAVFSAFSERDGISQEKALKVAAAFGAGIARRGEMCGAVSGALMAIGWRHGATKSEDQAAKEKTYALSQEFMRRFKALHGSLECRDLLGVDLSTPEGMKEVKEKHLASTVCPNSCATPLGSSRKSCMTTKNDLAPFLRATDVIDHDHPAVRLTTSGLSPAVICIRFFGFPARPN